MTETKTFDHDSSEPGAIETEMRVFPVAPLNRVKTVSASYLR